MDSNKYDVFISCKSEDYKYAEEVYDFLIKNHFNTFLASKELRKLGDSQYRESIEEALDSTEHIIVFSSDPEYPKAKYVKYEWGLFVDLKLDNQKDGNILTILKDMTPRELPIALRRYESFEFENYQERLLDYVETDEHKERLSKIREESKQEEQKRREEQERERQRLILLDQIKEDAEVFIKKQAEIELEIIKLRNLSKSVGIDTKHCKICNAKFDLEEEFCSVCGWKFHPLEGIEGVEHLIKNNPKHTELHKKLYATLHGDKIDANADKSEKSTKEKDSNAANPNPEANKPGWNPADMLNDVFNKFGMKSGDKKDVETYVAGQILEKFILHSKTQQISSHASFTETYIQVNWDGLYDFIKNTLGYDISRTILKLNIVEFWDYNFQPKWKVERALNRVLSKYQFKKDIAKFSANRNIDWSKIQENEIKWDALIKYLYHTYGVTLKKWQLFSSAAEKFVSIDQIADRIYERISGNDIQLYPIKK